MKRREALRNVLLVSAGGALLYSCKGNELDLMTELTEFILPGSQSLKTKEFVVMMTHDCLPPDAQAKFEAGMKVFTEKGFADMSPEERNQFVDTLDGDAKAFYEMVKDGTIENFTTSEQYLKDVRGVTDLIPKKFQACVPVNS